MEKSKCELVFILDRSGSMSGLESDTIGGFNSMLEKQKKVEGEAKVTTVLFDDKYELLHDRFDIEDVRHMTIVDYYVRGTTALLDAIGLTIDKIVKVQKNQSKSARADKVIFVIITDGMENASCKYNYSMVKQLIKHEEEFGWEFIFMGANIDAEKEAGRIGIKKDRAANYHADKDGLMNMYGFVESAVSEYRNGKSIKHNWKSKIEEDFKKRKANK